MNGALSRENCRAVWIVGNAPLPRCQQSNTAINFRLKKDACACERYVTKHLGPWLHTCLWACAEMAAYRIASLIPADGFYPPGNFCNIAGITYWRRPQKDCLSVFKLCSLQIPSERLFFFWSVKVKEKKRAVLPCICIPHCQLTGKLNIAKTKIALTSVLDLWVSSWKGFGQRCGMGFWKSRCRFLGVRVILLAAIIYIRVGSGAWTSCVNMHPPAAFLGYSIYLGPLCSLVEAYFYVWLRSHGEIQRPHI